MEKIFEGLGINPAVLISQVAAFLFLFWILSRFLFKRIGQVIEQREKEIKESYQQVEQKDKEAEKLAKEYRQRIDEIDKECVQRINSAVEEGKKMADMIVNEAREKRLQEEQKARENIQMEREKMFIELRHDIVNLSLTVAEKLLGEKLDREKDRALVEKFVADIEKLKK
jgi:F-type H+-transporting ATPase subunit b